MRTPTSQPPEYRLANKIRQLRTAERHVAFVIVEGEGSDRRFYREFLDETLCRILPANGKGHVLNVIAILDRDSRFKGAVGIVDADRCRVLGNVPASPNVVLTDACDLEAMLFLSPAGGKLVRELTSDEKVKEFEKQTGVTVMERLLDSARTLGALRLVSERDGLNLKFQELQFKKFIDKATLEVDVGKLVRIILDRTGGSDVSNDDLHQRLDVVLDSELSAADLCNGHDLLKILALGVRSAVGDHKATAVTPEILERSLRLAYERVHFPGTGVYRELRRWENGNEPFRVLRAA